MRSPMVKFVALAFVCLLAGPALAAEPRYYPRESGPGPRGFEQGEFRLRLGLYDLRGSSNFWDDNALVFTGGPGDLQDVVVGGDLLWSINPNLSLMFSGEYYEGTTTQFYRDPALSDLGHETSLLITPLKVGLLIYPAGRRAPVIPYLGGGGGLYWWRYEESGNFWDFTFAEVTHQSYTADGVTAGYFFVAGLEVPVRPYWSFFFEGQWQHATDTLNQDFGGFGDIDLSGTEVSAGFAWKF